MADASMVVRVSGNIDDLKKKLADGKAVIDGVAVGMRQVGRTANDDLYKSFKQVDNILSSVGINVNSDVKALGQLSEVAKTGAGSLDGIAQAGLVAAAAFAGWNIGRKISELFNLDKVVGDVTAKLLGFGDVAGQEAAAKADTLARASKLAGIEITDMGTAVKLLTEVAKENADRLNTSANRIASWRGEIAKVKNDGNWELLTADIKSQNFELKELHDRYGISVEAIQFYVRETEKADKAITESNQRKIEAIKRASEAQKEQAEQQEKVSTAIDHLLLAQGKYDQVLAAFSPTLIDQVRYYRDLGLSVQDVAVILNEVPSKVERVEGALKAQESVLDEVHQKWVALEAEHAKLCDEMAANAQKSAEAQAAAFKKINDELDALLHKSTPGNSIQYDLSTKEGFQKFRQLNPSAYISSELTPDYFKTHTLQDAIAAHLIDLYAGFKGRFAEGVTNFGGGVALVGERGPELVRLPRGSDVIPNHALGGSVVININGSVLGDPDKIAAAVNAAMKTRLSGIGTRWSTGT